MRKAMADTLRMNANNEWLSVGWSLRLKTLDVMAQMRSESCREAATEYSPGLQPWVAQMTTRALKVAPDASAIRGINTPLTEYIPRSPLSGRFDALPNPGLKPWAILFNRFAVARFTDPARAKLGERSD